MFAQSRLAIVMCMRLFLVFSTALYGLSYNAAATARQDGQSLYPSDIVAPVQAANSDTSAPQQLQSILTEPKNISDELSDALGAAAFVATPTQSTSEFERLIREAIGRRPVFHAQLSALSETRAGKRLARSALYPQLSAQLSGDYVLTRDFGETTDNVVESLRPTEQVTAGLSVSQLIFDGGATSNRIRAARARHEEFEHALSTRINELALTSLSIYHDALTHQALVSIASDFIKRHQEILENVRERERLGARSKADSTQAAARLAAAHARFAEIRESAQLADIRFQEFFQGDQQKLQRPIIDVEYARTRDEAVDLALAGSPELAAASARANASKAEFKAARSARLPELRASVDAVKFDIFDSGDDFDIRAGLNVNYNLFGGGARSATIAQAGSRAKQDRFGEDQMRRDIERDAAISFERVHGARARLVALEAAVIANNKTRELVLERYKLARGDLIDVLQAESDFFDSSVAYLSGLTNLDLVKYELMQNTGELTERFAPRDAGEGYAYE